MPIPVLSYTLFEGVSERRCEPAEVRPQLLTRKINWFDRWNSKFNGILIGADMDHTVVQVLPVA